MKFRIGFQTHIPVGVIVASLDALKNSVRFVVSRLFFHETHANLFLKTNVQQFSFEALRLIRIEFVAIDELLLPELQNVRVDFFFHNLNYSLDLCRHIMLVKELLVLAKNIYLIVVDAVVLAAANAVQLFLDHFLLEPRFLILESLNKHFKL